MSGKQLDLESMMWKKKQQPETPKTDLEKRIDKIATPDLMSWADQALFGVGRSLSDWERYKNEDSLEEAYMGAEALAKVLAAIIQRTKS